MTPQTRSFETFQFDIFIQKMSEDNKVMIMKLSIYKFGKNRKIDIKYTYSIQ